MVQDYIELMTGDNAAKQVLRNERASKILTREIGAEYAGKTFDEYTDKSIVEKIKRDLAGKKWLYIHGDSRAGKTHLAAAIYKYFIGENINARIKRCILLDMIISDYDDPDRMYRIDGLKDAPVLILDDIGVGKLTPERHMMYYYIIDHRLCNGLKTIFTANVKTNLLWSGTTDSEATRIITRIQEASTGVEVKKEKPNAV